LVEEHRLQTVHPASPASRGTRAGRPVGTSRWLLRLSTLGLLALNALLSGCGDLNATPCQVVEFASEIRDLAVYEARLTMALRDDVIQIGNEEYRQLFQFRDRLIRYYEQEKALPPEFLNDLIRLKDQEIARPRVQSWDCRSAHTR
jgi:hypothetical protein